MTTETIFTTELKKRLLKVIERRACILTETGNYAYFDYILPYRHTEGHRAYGPCIGLHLEAESPEEIMNDLIDSCERLQAETPPEQYYSNDAAFFFNEDYETGFKLFEGQSVVYIESNTVFESQEPELTRRPF